MEKEFEIVLSSGEKMKGFAMPVENPVAVLNLQTGMAEYAKRYAGFGNWLNERKVSLYVLDAFGQGLNSPNPDDQGKWPVDAFAKNVEGIHLMNEMSRVKGIPLATMGHSMGSFMTQSLIQRYPHNTDKVIICGSNGGQGFLMKMGNLIAKMKVNKKNWDLECPMLQNLGLGGYSKAIKDRKTDLDWLSYNEENVQKYIADPYCGHYNTGGFWHEFLKEMAHLWDAKNMKKVSKDEKILIIAGEEDPVGQNGKGPKWLEKKYKALGVEDVTLKLYPHARHEIHNEDIWETVYQDILDFILK